MAEREAELDEVYGWFREQVASSFGFLVDEFGCGAETQDEGGDGISRASATGRLRWRFHTNQPTTLSKSSSSSL